MKLKLIMIIRDSEFHFIKLFKFSYVLEGVCELPKLSCIV